MGKEEIPTTPDPKEFDPTNPDELASKLRNQEFDFKYEKKTLEEAQALGFPSVEAYALFKDVAMPFYRTGYIDASGNYVHGVDLEDVKRIRDVDLNRFVEPWHYPDWKTISLDEKRKRTMAFLEEIYTDIGEALKGFKQDTTTR